MKETFSKFTDLVAAVITLIKDNIQHKNQLRKQQLMAAKKAAMQNIAALMLQEIRQELFLAFTGSHYPSLHPITVPKHVRANGYRFVNNGIVFSYRLAAQNIPARTILDIIRSNMNADIYQCQQDLISSMGIYCAASLHPYIVSGLYVIDIYPDGADICIDVATNYDPYGFENCN